MSNFYELLSDVLNEKGKSFIDLENAGVIAPRTFYQFKKTTPFLPTIVKIANYLEVSLDYLAGRDDNNKFAPIKQINFYQNLINLMRLSKITQSKLAKELNFGRPNFQYWKNGSLPKFSLLIEMANYFGTSIDELVG